MRRLNLALLILASAALLFMFRRIDWPGLLHALMQGGPYLPLLVLPYGLTCLLWSLSWRAVLVAETGIPPLHRLFVLRLGGDSLNQLTPTASLGGEPFKALRLQAEGVGWREATASLVIHKGFMVLSLVLYIVLGLALIPIALPGISYRLALFCCLGTLLLALGGLGFLALQHRSPCLALLRLLQRYGIRPAALLAREAELAGLDASLAEFYRHYPRSCLLALLLFFLGWLAHALELYLIFRLMGHPITPVTALCLDALAQLVAGLGFMIPASLGVQDGGNILLSLGFNLGATAGAGFSILRRFREAFWLFLGLVVVAREKQGRGD